MRRRRKKWEEVKEDCDKKEEGMKRNMSEEK